AYAGHFGAGVRGVTGPPEEIAKLAGALGIFHRKVPSGDGNYSVDHSAAIIYIDREARYRALFSAPHDVAALAADIPVLMALR
ncbi:MAG: SCO family protein, partial [Woeseiaceae bacterium]